MNRFSYGWDLDDCHNWDLIGYPGWVAFGDDWYTPDDYLDELWKPVPGYSGGYWVSDYGRVFSAKSNKFLKPQADTCGHLQVRLCDGHKSRLHFVHRLMAELFIPNPNSYGVVRHLNDRPYDNTVDNLDWGTQADNMLDAAMNDSYRHVETPIRAINKITDEVLFFKSQHEAARSLGLPQGNISHVLRGKHRTCGGWKFEYVDRRRYYE